MAQSGDIGIDVGSSNIVIYMRGKGIVFREPAVVAVDRERKSILAFGTEAYRMIGRTPSNISIIRPLAQSGIVDVELAGTLLRYFVTSVTGKHVLSRPRAVMALPTSVKDMEKKIIISSMFDAGIRRTQLVDKCIAAALGAQVNFLGPYGSLIIDMSAGGSDLAVLYNGAVSVLSSIRIGGDQFDDSITRYIRRKYNLLIGERTAEQVKITLGGALRREPEVTMEITGRSLISGLPKTMSIESNEIYESLIDNINDFIEAIQVVVEKAPPQLASDIFENGITLSGGAAQLYGLAESVGKVMKIPCRIAQDSRDCVVLGCGRILNDPAGLRSLLDQ